jgi:hypothetical protein
MNIEGKRKTVDVLVVRLRRPGAMSWTRIIVWHGFGGKASELSRWTKD